MLDSALAALLTTLFAERISFTLVIQTRRLLAHPTHGFPLDVLSHPKWQNLLVLNVMRSDMHDMNTVVEADRLSCRLSFDRLVAVEVPFAAIVALTQQFEPEAEAGIGTDASGGSVHALPPPPARPMLRLVDDDG